MRYSINLYRIYKLLWDKKYRKIELEKQRLLKEPRYKKGETTLLIHPLRYVDANTCYYGYLDIIEKQPYKFTAKSGRPYIIDCGANIGLSVIYFKMLYPSCIIDAFEPDPNVYQVLKKNIEAFKLDNTRLHDTAIWNEDTTLEFQIEGGMSGRISKDGDKGKILQVPTTRLKTLLNKKVDFLKIDIEGAEHAVLLDCADQLHMVDFLFIEYHSHKAESQKLDEILNLLSSCNFRYHIHEAYTVRHPFIEDGDMLGMDLQLNIYAKRI